jgi:leucyl/phenylalanyl-tRNA--protein transferase
VIRSYPALLNPYAEECDFPDVSHALTEPNGLLAIGGSLAPGCLLSAYRRGIFPWYEQGQPILWWSPDPRTVLFPNRLHVSRSLRKTLRKEIFTVTFDHAFEEVMRACAATRRRIGTWITEEMIEAYVTLHAMGYAHSAETWYRGRLVGGLYGVALGRVFFGESMFHRETDASKVAFVVLVRHLEAWRFKVIDCQMKTSHLLSLGAEEISRAQFVELIDTCREDTCREDHVSWRVDRRLMQESGHREGPAIE